MQSVVSSAIHTSLVLQVWPWMDHRMWKKFVALPIAQGCPAATERLLSILQPAAGGVMWRTSKNSVAAELGIPEQEHVEQHLTLTAVEWHNYRYDRDQHVYFK